MPRKTKQKKESGNSPDSLVKESVKVEKLPVKSKKSPTKSNAQKLKSTKKSIASPKLSTVKPKKNALKPKLVKPKLAKTNTLKKNSEKTKILKGVKKTERKAKVVKGVKKAESKAKTVSKKVNEKLLEDLEEQSSEEEFKNESEDEIEDEFLDLPNNEDDFITKNNFIEDDLIPEDDFIEDDFIPEDDFIEDDFIEDDFIEDDFIEDDFIEDDFIEDDFIEEESPKKNKSKKVSIKSPKSSLNLTEKAKKDLMLPKNSKNVFKSAISPSRSQPRKNYKQTYSSELKKANLPNFDAIVEPIKIPTIKISKDGIVSVTPKGTKKFKENTETIKKILEEINVKMLAKEEGGKKNSEYNLTKLKSFIKRMGLPQNSDRNTAVRKILEELKNYSKISLDDYEIINKRLKDKENKKTLLMSKKY